MSWSDSGTAVAVPATEARADTPPERVEGGVRPLVHPVERCRSDRPALARQ